MWREYPNPLGTGMGFNFSSPLGMDRVMGKYMRIGYGDGEGKTHPHPASLPCLLAFELFQKTEILTFFSQEPTPKKVNGNGCLTAWTPTIEAN